MGYTFCASLFKCVTKIVIPKYITLMMLRESNLFCLSVISLSYPVMTRFRQNQVWKQFKNFDRKQFTFISKNFCFQNGVVTQILCRRNRQQMLVANIIFMIFLYKEESQNDGKDITQVCTIHEKSCYIVELACGTRTTTSYSLYLQSRIVMNLARFFLHVITGLQMIKIRMFDSKLWYYYDQRLVVQLRPLKF